MKTKYLFPIITFILSLGCAFIVAVKVFPNNPFTGNKTSENTASNIQEGDLIFQTSESKQCEAVRIATNSKFSHCGIIFKENGKWMVFEAVQPVKVTSFEQWIQHGRDSNYVIKRLKDTSALNTATLSKMKEYGKSLLGKDYDAYFEWTDNRIYCSELIWKVYQNGAGIELCKTKLLKDFNLTDPRIQPILQERYGNDIPLDEKVVAPSDLADSKLLKTIIDTY